MSFVEKIKVGNIVHSMKNIGEIVELSLRIDLSKMLITIGNERLERQIFLRLLTLSRLV